MKTRMMGRRALTLAAAFGFASVAFAETNTWIGAAGDSWATAGNWDPAAVPTASSMVLIPAGASITYDAEAVSVTNFIDKILLQGADASVRISNADASARHLHILGKTPDSDGLYRFVDSSQTLTFAGEGLEVEVAMEQDFGGRGIIAKGKIVADEKADVSLRHVDVGDNVLSLAAKGSANLYLKNNVDVYAGSELTIMGEGEGSDVYMSGALSMKNKGNFTLHLLATNHAYFGVAGINSKDGSAVLDFVSAGESTVQIGSFEKLAAGSSMLLAGGDINMNGDIVLGDSNPITLTVDGYGTFMNDNDSYGHEVKILSKATVKFKPNEVALGKPGVFYTGKTGGSGNDKYVADFTTIDPASKLDIDMTELGADMSTNHWEIPYVTCAYTVDKIQIPVITITEGYDCKFKIEHSDKVITKVTLVVNRSKAITWDQDGYTWDIDDGWLFPANAPKADDTAVFNKNAVVLFPTTDATAAGLTITGANTVKFVGGEDKSLVMEDDALKSSIAAGATVEVNGKGTFKFHNTQGTELGDGVTLKATEGGYFKVSHAKVAEEGTVTLIADGEGSHMKFEPANKVCNLNMAASNSGYLNMGGAEMNGLLNIAMSESRGDFKGLKPAAGSAISLTNSPLRIMGDGYMVLGQGGNATTLTLFGDDACILATNGQTDITFDAGLTAKLFPTTAWETRPLIQVRRSDTKEIHPFVLNGGTKFEIDAAGLGDLGDGKTFRLVQLNGASNVTITATLPEAGDVTLLNAPGYEAKFALVEDDQAIDITIAPASGEETVEEQVAAAKSGDVVPATGVVIAEGGKSFTYAGGAAPVTKDHYVFEAAEGGVKVEIDQAEAEIASIAIDGTTVTVTLENGAVDGFSYALESSATVDFADSSKTSFASAEGTVELTATAEGPARFYRAVVTDIPANE